MIIFWHRFRPPLGPILEPTWPQLGLQNRPKFGPRAIQNPFKIVSYFWYPFGQIFGGFWLQLGAQNHPQIHQKINPKASQRANNEKSKIARSSCNLQYFRALGYLNLGRKTIKNGSNILPKLASKTMLQVRSILNPTGLHFGRFLAPKLEPNWHQNALKRDPTSH